MFSLLLKDLISDFYGQLAPFDWSIRTLVNLHLYQTKVNSHLTIFHTFWCKLRNKLKFYGG